MKTIEAKIYPNEAQLKALNALLESCRLFYNTALAMKIDAYKEGVSLSAYDLQKIFASRSDLPSSAASQLLRRMDMAFNKFYRSKKGFPRFRAINRFRTIPLRMFGVDGDYKIRGNKLVIWPSYGIGSMKYRGLQEFEEAKGGRLVRRVNGWFLQMSVNTTTLKPKKVKTAVGIDVGLKAFTVDSEGNPTPAPKFFRIMENKLSIEQRKRSKTTKGGVRQRKANRQIALTHYKITNQRNDFLHKLSRWYSVNYDLVAVEKLNIKGMVRNRYLSKSISDASWGRFTFMLGYKLKTLGKHLVEVNPRMTTQLCSTCGVEVRKSLSVRTHACPNCGFVADRDHNAALNILKLGLEQAIGEGTAIAAPLTRKVSIHRSAKPDTDLINKII